MNVRAALLVSAIGGAVLLAGCSASEPESTHVEETTQSVESEPVVLEVSMPFPWKGAGDGGP